MEMLLPFNQDLIISEARYNDNHFSSTKQLARMRMTSPDFVNSLINYAYGSSAKFGKRNFPLLFDLSSKGNKRAIKSLDGTYQQRMYGKPRKTDFVKRVIPNQVRAGENGAFFKVAYSSKFFMKNEVISAGSLSKSVSAQVYGEPVRDGGAWIYTLKLTRTGMGIFCPDSLLKPGAIWAMGVVKVGLERSKGTDQRQPQTPFLFQNQLSLIRRSYKYAGNVSNKVISIPFEADGKKITLWTEWESYVDEIAYKQAVNEDLIFSDYNKNPDGSISNIDSDTGEAVPMGMGAWGQIPYETKYTTLTEAKLNDHLNVMLDANDMGGNDNEGDYIILAGSGLLEEIDKVLKRSSSRFLSLSDKAIRGNDPKNLQFGYYFTEFLHSSGKVIKFVYEPSFDKGAKADAAPRHPIYTRRSIMSYCGMALNNCLMDVSSDITSSGKQSNILLMYEDGREYEEWYVLGGAKVPMIEMSSHPSRATDVDASSKEIMSSQGIHIMYPGSCGKMLCTLS